MLKIKLRNQKSSNIINFKYLNKKNLFLNFIFLDNQKLLLHL